MLVFVALDTIMFFWSLLLLSLLLRFVQQCVILSVFPGNRLPVSLIQVLASNDTSFPYDQNDQQGSAIWIAIQTFIYAHLSCQEYQELANTSDARVCMN